MINLAVKRCLEAFGMLTKEPFFSLLFAVEALPMVIISAVKSAGKTSTLTASHCIVFNIADIVEVESF